VEAPVTPRLAVIAPAEKLPVESRFTMAFAVAAFVGATFHAKFSVPEVVTGDPVTVKSEVGAVNPTLVTEPVPEGNVWPAANVIRPWLEIESPVSVGVADPDPNSRFNLPDGAVLSLPTASACQRKFSFTAFFVLLSKVEAVKFMG
jgi:hypothetical protein